VTTVSDLDELQYDDDDPQPNGSANTIGSRLAALRKRKGVTGQDLGASAGMSQAKISKIETGAVTPTSRDVERLARALGASEHLVNALVEHTEGMHDRFTDWRIDVKRLANRQHELGSHEHRARTIRVFSPAIVPGLLQTTEYARTILGDVSTVLPDDGETEPVVPPAVSARIQRQEVLYDERKKFVFVLGETVLLNRICSAPVMVAQIHRLRTVAALPNVTIGIVPTDTELAFPPLQGFDIFDDRLVTAEMVGTVVTSRGKVDVRMYRSVFDSYLDRAVFDLEDILNKYISLYADEAHPLPARA
jgi:transcriptional regulator with XRE-family HTH domain